MLNYTPCDEIKSLFIDVSEEIENNNLKKFIFTSLKLNNFEINKNDFLLINFIHELKQFQKSIKMQFSKYLNYIIWKKMV